MICALLGAGSGQGRLVLAILVGIGGLGLTGCSSRTFDRERFAETAARYSAKPLHKALYMNTVDFTLYQRIDGADVQDMLALAEQDCKDSSARRGIDPGRCAPLYMDNQRLIDPDVYQ
jgi:hypothetical protein